MIGQRKKWRRWIGGLLGSCVLAVGVFTSTAFAEGCCDEVPVKVTLADGSKKWGFLQFYCITIQGTEITETVVPTNNSTRNSGGGEYTSLGQGELPYLSIGHTSFVSMEYSHHILVLKDEDGTKWKVTYPECNFFFYPDKLPNPNLPVPKTKQMLLRIPNFKSIVRTGETIEIDDGD